MSGLGFALKALLPWTLEHDFLDLKILKAHKEYFGYCCWRAAKVLKEFGVLKDFNGRSILDLSKSYHRETLELTLSALKEGGYIKIKEGVVSVIKEPRDPPKVTTEYVLEIIPVVDRVMDTLPHCLKTGEKRFLWLSKESKAAFLKLLELTAYKKIRAYIIHWSNLTKLEEDKIIVDVGAGMGLSTAALLQHTEARVIAVDPDPSSLDFARDYIRFLGLDLSRVEFVCCRAEDMVKHINRECDAFLLIGVIHWLDDPTTTLKNVRKLSKRDTKMVIGQITAERYLKGHLVPYLMGAKMLPTYKEFMAMMRRAGFTLVKKTMHPIPSFVFKPS